LEQSIAEENVQLPKREMPLVTNNSFKVEVGIVDVYL
jgi:hypothetical protein